MPRRHFVFEISQQLPELFREIVGRRLTSIALQGKRRRMIAARRATQSEVHSIRKQRAQNAERLRDLERTIMRQHHAAASNSDSPRDGPDRRDHHFGTGAREHRRPVMLRHPITLVTELFR